MNKLKGVFVNTKYLSMQLKQFALSTAFVAVAAIGLSLSTSFDRSYMAEVEKAEQEQTLERVAKLEKKADKKVGVAMN